MSIIAIDWGGRRIGVAVSDSGSIATPHSVVKNEGEIIDKLARIASELGAETIVVGIARRAKSDSGEQKFRDFAERLRQKTCKPVVLWDEALSTTEAARQLRESGTKRRDAQREIDMHAAAVILQSYLDAEARRAS
ncbi:MAG: putative pre6S rRNA nuclease [Thermoanaerobaculia bacterium]|jgi:putative Holliday junction resolvase|nr:putative pre6S rRNA nuclease [Thermoanaerobaculia bacterium]